MALAGFGASCDDDEIRPDLGIEPDRVRDIVPLLWMLTTSNHCLSTHSHPLLQTTQAHSVTQ